MVRIRRVGAGGVRRGGADRARRIEPWPALDALLASTVTETQRSTRFALRHGTFNLGFGVGAIVAAAIVDFGSVRSFRNPVSRRRRNVSRRRADSRRASRRPATGGKPDEPCRSVATAKCLRGPNVSRSVGDHGVTLRRRIRPVRGCSTSVRNGDRRGLRAWARLRLRGQHVRGRRLQLSSSASSRAAAAPPPSSAASLMMGCAWRHRDRGAHVGGAPGGRRVRMRDGGARPRERRCSPPRSPHRQRPRPDRLRGRYNGTYVLAYTTGFTVGPALAGGGLKLGDGTRISCCWSWAPRPRRFASLALRRRLPAPSTGRRSSRGRNRRPPSERFATRRREPRPEGDTEPRGRAAQGTQATHEKEATSATRTGSPANENEDRGNRRQSDRQRLAANTNEL